eukprot:337699_1
MGEANLSNITIQSHTFESDIRTTDWEEDSNTSPPAFDMYWLVYAALLSVVLLSILGCCYKSKQIRAQMNKEQHMSHLHTKSQKRDHEKTTVRNNNYKEPHLNKVLSVRSDSTTSRLPLERVASVGYLWIEETLKVIADTEFEMYLKKFQTQKVTDTR